MKSKLRRFYSFLLIFSVFLIGGALTSVPVSAADGEFNLQVSPSPLVATLKPGQQSILDLKIRNAGVESERLTITPKVFKIANDGQIEFNDTQAPEIASWLRFSEKDFTVAPGERFTQKITVNVPREAGFSYSFALVITRQSTEGAAVRGQELKGQVAVFALLNVDRPGATRQLQLESLKTEAGIYEYLPSTFTLRLKNTGNSIVQPAGNIFVQRGSNDERPIGALQANEGGGYILPGTVRELTVQWKDGFPVIKEDTSQSPAKTYEDWDLKNISNIRIGRYVAKAVVVYNDGQRDIPLVAEVGFWVIPWKFLLVVLLILGLVGLGVWSLVRQLMRFSRRGRSSVRLRK